MCKIWLVKNVLITHVIPLEILKSKNIKLWRVTCVLQRLENISICSVSSCCTNYFCGHASLASRAMNSLYRQRWWAVLIRAEWWRCNHTGVWKTVRYWKRRHWQVWVKTRFKGTEVPLSSLRSPGGGCGRCPLQLPQVQCCLVDPRVLLALRRDLGGDGHVVVLIRQRGVPVIGAGVAVLRRGHFVVHFQHFLL